MSMSDLLVRRYRVTCDQCGEQGPEGTSAKEAQSLATDAGWRKWSRWTGANHITRDLCQGCPDPKEGWDRLL